MALCAGMGRKWSGRLYFLLGIFKWSGRLYFLLGILL